MGFTSFWWHLASLVSENGCWQRKSIRLYVSLTIEVFFVNNWAIVRLEWCLTGRQQSGNDQRISRRRAAVCFLLLSCSDANHQIALNLITATCERRKYPSIVRNIDAQLSARTGMVQTADRGALAYAISASVASELETAFCDV
jgi:hypothetical protein